MTRFVFITGGVMSSIGKGISAAALGSLLQSRGFTVRLKKLDPYINMNPGAMSPYRHGEVYVMGDGCEADLDFGHYERFTDIACSKDDSITTGKIYSRVLGKEQKGEYFGSDIQVIPHITNEIKNFILNGSNEVDFTICEIGGTIGDIEGLPYIEALRQLKIELPSNSVAFIHLTYLPYIKTSGELKTKPTQHSVKSLQSLGIQPDIIMCRTEYPITDDIKSKLSMFCNVKKSNVIEALDASSIYLVPKNYHQAGLDVQICEHFKLSDLIDFETNFDNKWGKIEKAIVSPSKVAHIAVVGKYTKLKDVYISLCQAIQHAGFANDAKVEVDWINTDNPWNIIQNQLENAKGLIVPNGTEPQEVEKVLETIRYARENDMPFVGINTGMHLAVIEACRNIGGEKAAVSREFSTTGVFVIDDVQYAERKDENIREQNSHSGKMLLGNYNCHLVENTLVKKIYNTEEVVERHRYGYEINFQQYQGVLERSGVEVSGFSGIDQKVVEAIERRDHTFFIGIQYQPEFISRPFLAHPILKKFIGASLVK